MLGIAISHKFYKYKTLTLFISHKLALSVPATKDTECSTHIVACQQGRVSIKPKRLAKSLSQTLLTNISFWIQNPHSYSLCSFKGKTLTQLSCTIPQDTAHHNAAVDKNGVIHVAYIKLEWSLRYNPERFCSLTW